MASKTSYLLYINHQSESIIYCIQLPTCSFIPIFLRRKASSLPLMASSARLRLSTYSTLVLYRIVNHKSIHDEERGAYVQSSKNTCEKDKSERLLGLSACVSATLPIVLKIISTRFLKKAAFRRQASIKNKDI